ncbi:ATP-grasp domain-containing protein [Gemmata obscuriglobus]|uniref:ATP-grasp fold PylC-type domain-containing protein n=1 Tax=Gemmata obscuriglobus TaxID=114 RepID=A0A2Z3GXD5_9BACT|nr:ATP-grasp domain-containing protein [Gemmata obscuriglobus]AWM36672.1 hypothetical protein C1280_06320 [Gemmata obscuriglobus]
MQFPPGPVLYTGGLENYPHVIARLAESRELWGNPPEVLARARDPFELFPILQRAGFEPPRLVPRGEPCPTEGRWLRKPFASGGGIGIRFTEPGEAASDRHYFQEWVEGVPMSAVFVSDLNEMPFWPDGTELFGVTQQLIGEPWLHAEPFAYCGNIGPVELPQSAALWINTLDANRTIGVRGCWGLDFIQRSDSLHPVEVNPRYTAAIEVIELATRSAIMPTHRDCFSSNPTRFHFVAPPRGCAPVGKAIYYAPHAITFPNAGPWDADLAGAFDPWRLPGFADIPDPGSAIQPGWPVLTFFATGSTPADVRERLRSRAAELDRLFAEHSL